MTARPAAAPVLAIPRQPRASMTRSRGTTRTSSSLTRHPRGAPAPPRTAPAGPPRRRLRRPPPRRGGRASRRAGRASPGRPRPAVRALVAAMPAPIAGSPRARRVGPGPAARGQCRRGRPARRDRRSRRARDRLHQGRGDHERQVADRGDGGVVLDRRSCAAAARRRPGPARSTRATPASSPAGGRDDDPRPVAEEVDRPGREAARLAARHRVSADEAQAEARRALGEERLRARHVADDGIGAERGAVGPARAPRSSRQAAGGAASTTRSAPLTRLAQRRRGDVDRPPARGRPAARLPTASRRPRASRPRGPPGRSIRRSGRGRGGRGAPAVRRRGDAGRGVARPGGARRRRPGDPGSPGGFWRRMRSRRSTPAALQVHLHAAARAAALVDEERRERRGRVDLAAAVPAREAGHGPILRCRARRPARSSADRRKALEGPRDLLGRVLVVDRAPRPGSARRPTGRSGRGRSG